MTAPLEAFFLAADAGRIGQRFCLLHTPVGRPVESIVVFVHSFAEEMNKSRRTVALQARAFAQAGHAVLQVDLLGCGDSSGDFGDATWADWVQDVRQAADWMRQRHPGRRLRLWGLRAGCLLATQAAMRLDEPCDFLFWQAPASGKTLLQQFLRLQLAADMIDGKGKGSMDEVKRRLAAGDTVEIAGYRLSPALANGLEQAKLVLPAASGCVDWLESSPREDATLLPASERLLGEWRLGEVDVRDQVVRGPSFWQSTEIEEGSTLIDASLRALHRSSTAVPA